MSVFEHEQADSMEFIRFLQRRWKQIVTAVVATMVLTAVVTFFLPNRYYSYGIVFPAFNNSVETVIDNPTFGYDVEADRLLQMMQSEVVRDSVIRKFKLNEYYGLDTTNPEWRDKLAIAYVKDVQFARTPYMSIVVSAETTNPKLSADIVNYIIDLSDGLRDRIYKRNILAAYRSIEREYVAKKVIVDTLKFKVGRLREKLGSFDSRMVKPNEVAEVSAEDSKTFLSSELERSTNQYVYEQTRLNEISSRYEKAKAQYERPITLIYILDRARPSYKKTSPSFMLNLSLAGMAALLVSIGVLLFSEKLARSKA